MTTLKLGHLDYEVKVEPDLHHEDGSKVLGYCNRTNSQVIAVDSSLKGSRRAEVLLHEVLHACWYFGCLGKESEEERAVDVLASTLVTVARDNPWFLPELQRMAEGKPGRIIR